MYLICGLGNPGDRYKLNRHNIGFMVIDEMTKNLNTTNINRSNFKADVKKSADSLYVKPLTYMNASGESIYPIKEYYKIDIGKVIVVHDDLDLPFGALKFKIGGGHGGHNGLRSIDSHIGKDYIRVRFGIGKPTDKSKVVNYVLDNFSKEELNKVFDNISTVIESIEMLKCRSLDEVRQRYTIKSL
jgi:PTH1 family peptidyl-tRNA hydrolase